MQYCKYEGCNNLVQDSYRHKHFQRNNVCTACKALRHKYDIDNGMRLDMLNEIDWKCEACQDTIHLSEKGHMNLKTATIDHDHKKKEKHIRGILCNACNTALGKLDDDPIKVLRLLNYIMNKS